MTEGSQIAWEIQPDGTMEIVIIRSRSIWPGAVKIERINGTTATVQATDLCDAEGTRLHSSKVMV